jgi:hypothetical protein
MMGIMVTTIARRSRLVIAGKSYPNSTGGGDVSHSICIFCALSSACIRKRGLRTRFGLPWERGKAKAVGAFFAEKDPVGMELKR